MADLKIKQITASSAEGRGTLYILTEDGRMFYCDMDEQENQKKWLEIKGPDLSDTFEIDIPGRAYYLPQK